MVFVVATDADEDVENVIGGNLILSCKTVKASKYKSLGRTPFTKMPARYEKPRNPSKKKSPMKDRHSIISPKKGLAILPGSGAVNGSVDEDLSSVISGKSQSNALAKI
mmetsp:Transcript_3361/g.4121  ORF Transcript_3361/g.4121 Transcript_3361/m.4121 type:complete len:108 (-) Transcript_3361:348-671(-)